MFTKRKWLFSGFEINGSYIINVGSRMEFTKRVCKDMEGWSLEGSPITTVHNSANYGEGKNWSELVLEGIGLNGEGKHYDFDKSVELKD